MIYSNINLRPTPTQEPKGAKRRRALLKIRPYVQDLQQFLADAAERDKKKKKRKEPDDDEPPEIKKKRRKIGRPKSVTPSAPATWTSHDLRRSLLVFDSWRLRHMNSPHTRGDRYAIVLYNKDMDYKGTDLDPKSTALKQTRKLPAPAKTYRHTTFAAAPVPSFAPGRGTAGKALPVHEEALVAAEAAAEAARRCCRAAEVTAARVALERLLARTSFPQDQTSGGSTRTDEEGAGNIKYGTNKARLLSFGATASRRSRAARAEQGKLTRRERNCNNTNRHAPLYEATKRYLRLFDERLFGEGDWPRCQFDAFIIAKNSQCVWHYDYTNLGPAAITVLGDYDGGGQLLVETDNLTHV